MINTNTWNRIRYTLLSPIYNSVVGSFEEDRQRSITLLNLQAGESVLLLGCGSGLDLRYIPHGVNITAIDITPAMVEKTRQQAADLGIKIDAQIMDGQALLFSTDQFDVVVLNLILAVIPDPIACIKEAVRVLKPNGRAVIFDKFLPANQQPSLGRRALNLLTNLVFSDINRQLQPILDEVSVKIDHTENAKAYARLGYSITLIRK